MPEQVSAVIMASGRSSRYHKNKLLETVRGETVIRRAIGAMIGGGFDPVLVVSGCREVLEAAAAMGAVPVENPDTTDDTAVTVRLGVERVPEGNAGCALFVADQPLFRPESAAGLLDCFLREPDRICQVRSGTRRGNPVIFPRCLFGELKTLSPNQRGRTVIARHPDLLRFFEIPDERELRDLDTPEDLENLR